MDEIRAKLLQLDALSESIANVECYEPEHEPVEKQINTLVEEIEAACPGFACEQVDTAFTDYHTKLRYALVPIREQGAWHGRDNEETT